MQLSVDDLPMYPAGLHAWLVDLEAGRSYVSQRDRPRYRSQEADAIVRQMRAFRPQWR
jgi:hypothetical protein